MLNDLRRGDRETFVAFTSVVLVLGFLAAEEGDRGLRLGSEPRMTATPYRVCVAHVPRLG